MRYRFGRLEQFDDPAVAVVRRRGGGRVARAASSCGSIAASVFGLPPTWATLVAGGAAIARRSPGRSIFSSIWLKRTDQEIVTESRGDGARRR